MKEIGTISLERLNNGAHYLFIFNVLSRAQADEKIMEKSQLTPLVAALDAALKQEDEDLKISRKSLLTDDITEADANRDSLYSAYKRVVKSYLDFPDTEVAQAAKVLNQHIKDYGIDPQMQLDRETGLLVNFIADLQDKYAEQVAALALTPFIGKLNQANAQVMAFTNQRTEERMEIVTGALKASRANSDAAYRALVKMVNALALVLGDADYVDFIDYVNTEIVHYKREVIGQKATSTTTGSSSSGNSDSEEDSSSDSESGGSGSSSGSDLDENPLG